MSTSFLLSTKKTVGTAPLYFRKRVRPIGKTFWINTKMVVDIEDWMKADTQKKKDNYLKKVGYAEVLENIVKAVDKLIAERVYSVDRFNEIVDIFANSEVRKVLEQAKKEREERENGFMPTLVKYCADITQGKRMSVMTNDRYSPSTANVWNSFCKAMTEFQEEHPFTWKDIDKKLLDKFRGWLMDRGLMKQSISRYMSIFCSFMRNTVEIHNNYAILMQFHSIKTRESDKRKEIYLTQEELDALYKAQFVEKLGAVRDIFLVGCYTCQRFSDYSRIDRSRVTTTPTGTPVIKLEQKKTGTSVTIPILDDRLLAILERYDYKLPVISDRMFNAMIKVVMHQLSETVPSLQKLERTHLQSSQRLSERLGWNTYERDEKGNTVMPRWQLVSSHTARRTGITLMYLSHKYDILQMMSVSGHKNTETFKAYIRLSSDEIADEMSRKAR